MNAAFVNVKCINLNSNDWNLPKGCYEVSAVLLETKLTSIHSIRIDEIADVEHRAYDLIVTDIANHNSTTLKYYYIKVHTPTGHGINGISTNVRVTEASYKRICSTLDITIDKNVD